MPLTYYVVVDKITVEFQNSIKWFRYVEEAVLHAIQSEILQFTTTRVNWHLNDKRH